MYISGDPNGYASHMPVLKWAVEHTFGPIFEMGGGLFSTPYLVSTGREVTTHELDGDWASHIQGSVGKSKRHTWTQETPTSRFSVAFLDGGRDECWLEDRRAMFDAVDADLILVHDLFPHLFCEDWRPWYLADKRFEQNVWYWPDGGHPSTWITSDELPPVASLGL